MLDPRMDFAWGSRGRPLRWEGVESPPRIMARISFMHVGGPLESPASTREFRPPPRRLEKNYRQGTIVDTPDHVRHRFPGHVGRFRDRFLENSCHERWTPCVTSGTHDAPVPARGSTDIRNGGGNGLSFRLPAGKNGGGNVQSTVHSGYITILTKTSWQPLRRPMGSPRGWW